jgi:tetratricopeptide (TPR) repeat protein
VSYRLAALSLGLLPFVLAEALLALFGWGPPDDHDDPFVGFSSTRSLFVLNEDSGRYEIPPARQKLFRPESFNAEKGPDEVRIFCLGGSTVQGRPFAVETSFTTWLELGLQAADPRRQWDVVNCGGVSYASYRLAPILEEVLGYEPDLIIVYTGHNEFLEERTYGHIKHAPAAVKRLQELASRLRTCRLLREGYLRLKGEPRRAPEADRPVLGHEVAAMLDYRGGLEKYGRDEKWRRDVIDHFDYNLRRMASMARGAGVPLLLVNPVCNVRDCPPFKSQHRDGLTSAEKARWKSLWTRARGLYRSDLRGAIEHLQEALAIDDQHAGLHYELAKCWDAVGETAEARAAYIRAKELDVCPLRILEPMSEALLRIAKQTATPLVDARRLAEQRGRQDAAGGYLLVDHVHPSIRGHQIIADAIAEELVRLGFVKPAPGWKDRRDRKCREHFASLDDLYFVEGQRRLESLRGWAQGRATLPPPQRTGQDKGTGSRGATAQQEKDGLAPAYGGQ